MKLHNALITGTVLATTGIIKTYQDYNTSPKEERLKTLARNATALSVATAAVFATDYLFYKKITNQNMQNWTKKLAQKIIPESIMKKLNLNIVTDIITNTVKSVTLLFAALTSGIISGNIVDKFLNKLKPETVNTINNFELQNEKFHKTFEKFKHNKLIDKINTDKNKNLFLNTARVFEAAGILENPFDKPLLVLQGIDASKDKKFTKILGETSSGILSDVLIPTTIITIIHSLTSKLKLPIRITALAGAFYLGNIAAKYTNLAIKKEDMIKKEA